MRKIDKGTLVRASAAMAGLVALVSTVGAGTKWMN